MSIRYLISCLIISLPLVSYPLLNYKGRAIQLDWAVVALLSLSFYTHFMMRTHYIKFGEHKLVCASTVLFIALTSSLITPLYSGAASLMEEFFTTWAQYLIGIILFILCLNIRLEEKDLIWYLKLYLIVVFIVAVFGIIQFVASLIFHIDLYPHLHSAKYSEIGKTLAYRQYLGHIKRPVSIFYEPRHFGSFVVTSVFILYLCLIHRMSILYKSKVTKLFFVTILIAIVLSFSLSAYMAFSLMFISFYITGQFRKKISYIVLIIMFVVILDIILDSFTGTSVFGYFWKRSYIKISDLKNINDFSVHYFGPLRYIRGYYSCFQLFKSHPLFGVGLNNTYFYIDPFFARTPPPADLLASTGLVGFLCFFYFVFYFLRSLLKLKNRLVMNSKYQFYSYIACIFAISASIKSFFASNYSYSSSWFWFELSFSALIYSNLKAKFKNNSNSGVAKTKKQKVIMTK